jgi:hypothetical protein
MSHFFLMFASSLLSSGVLVAQTERGQTAGEASEPADEK